MKAMVPSYDEDLDSQKWPLASELSEEAFKTLLYPIS